MSLHHKTKALRALLGFLLSTCLVIVASFHGHAASRAVAQQGFGDPEGSMARSVTWRRALQVERGRPLLEAWVAAGPEQRAQMVATLDAGVDPRRSRKRSLPMEFLSRAWRSPSQGGPEDSRARWLDLVDSVDLRVIPGAFNARSEGRGEPITVRLTSIWDSLVGEDEEDARVEVALIWVSATGRELIARRETGTAANIEAGFDMYIRPPLSEAGVWGLILEVQTPVGLLRSRAVPVECVEDLPGLRDRLTEPSDSAIAHGLATRIDLLIHHGIRTSSGSTIASWIEGMDGEAGATSQFGGYDLRPLDGAELGVPGQVFWQLQAEEKPRGVLLVLANKNESGVDLFSGPRLAAWHELARTCGLRIITGYVPIRITSGAPLVDCVAQIKRDYPGSLMVLGRGESGQLVPSLIADEDELTVDALIQSETLGAGGQLPAGIGCPALQVVSGLSAITSEASEVGEGELRRTRELLLAQDPIAAYEATGIIQSWIQSL